MYFFCHCVRQIFFYCTLSFGLFFPKYLYYILYPYYLYIITSLLIVTSVLLRPSFYLPLLIVLCYVALLCFLNIKGSIFSRYIKQSIGYFLVCCLYVFAIQSPLRLALSLCFFPPVEHSKLC